MCAKVSAKFFPVCVGKWLAGFELWGRLWSLHSCRARPPCFCFFFLFFKIEVYIVDLQYCVSFRCTTKGFMYMATHSSILARVIP